MKHLLWPNISELNILRTNALTRAEGVYNKNVHPTKKREIVPSPIRFKGAISGVQEPQTIDQCAIANASRNLICAANSQKVCINYNLRQFVKVKCVNQLKRGFFVAKMTLLNKEAGTSDKDSANKLPLDANVLMSRVCQLEEHLKAGLIELKSAVYGTEEVKTPDTVTECVAKIAKFEAHVKEEIANIKSTILQTDTKLDDLHQRMLSNNLLFFGIKEKTGERVQTTVCSTVRDQLGYIIAPRDIDFSFRLGKLGSHDCRPILVGFVNRWVRQDIFASKSLLKGTKIVIKENLTPRRLKLFKEISALVGFRNCWTMSGTIYVKQGETRQQINEISDLKKSV